MAILNYTTKIAATKTIGEIAEILARNGVSSISTDYENGCPTGLNFLIIVNGVYLNFRLPCNYEGVFKALCKDREVPKQFKTQEQAQKVAWRILKTWIEAQLAVIEAGQATMPEVFLPYLITPNGQTLYQLVEQQKLPLLNGAKENER